VGAHTLTTNPATTGGTAGLTVELCESTCLALGYTLSGSEGGGECYCGSTISNGGTLAPDGEASCNMPCNGNVTEICGGSDRLSVWEYGTISVVSTWATSALHSFNSRSTLKSLSLLLSDSATLT
jgi:hypothetical protein